MYYGSEEFHRSVGRRPRDDQEGSTYLDLVREGARDNQDEIRAAGAEAKDFHEKMGRIYSEAPGKILNAYWSGAQHNRSNKLAEEQLAQGGQQRSHVAQQMERGALDLADAQRQSAYYNRTDPTTGKTKFESLAEEGENRDRQQAKQAADLHAAQLKQIGATMNANTLNNSLVKNQLESAEMDKRLKLAQAAYADAKAQAGGKEPDYSVVAARVPGLKPEEFTLAAVNARGAAASTELTRKQLENELESAEMDKRLKLAQAAYADAKAQAGGKEPDYSVVAARVPGLKPEEFTLAAVNARGAAASTELTRKQLDPQYQELVTVQQAVKPKLQLVGNLLDNFQQFEANKQKLGDSWEKTNFYEKGAGTDARMNFASALRNLGQHQLATDIEGGAVGGWTGGRMKEAVTRAVDNLKNEINQNVARVPGYEQDPIVQGMKREIAAIEAQMASMGIASPGSVNQVNLNQGAGPGPLKDGRNAFQAGFGQAPQPAPTGAGQVQQVPMTPQPSYRHRQINQPGKGT